MSEVHVLVAEIQMLGNQKIFVPVNFFNDKPRAEVEKRLAMESAGLMMQGSIIAEVGGKPIKVAAVTQLLQNLGITGIGYNILSAETQGIIEKPGLTPTSIVLPKDTTH